MLTILNHSPGIYINNINNRVKIEIVLLNALFIVILLGLNLTVSLFNVLFALLEEKEAGHM